MDVRVLKLGRPQSGPRLLITAGVHGDEFEPVAAMYSLFDELQTQKIRGEVTLIPAANLPALQRGRRTAEDERDLARTCPGNAAGSLTERIAASLSEYIRDSDYYIDLHTGGSQLRLAPMAGYMLHPDAAILAKQREMATAFNLPVIWGTTPNLEGRTLSVARDSLVPAIYVEHGGGGAFDVRAQDELQGGCLGVMRQLGMIEGLPIESHVSIHVEDNRSESGHLQICHAAARDGCFVPKVCVGANVVRGESLGEILDIETGNKTIVAAEQSGYLLMLRAAPHVEAGDGLAVIIELGDSPGSESLI